MARGLAVVAEEIGRIVVRDVTVPEPGPDDIVVRATHSWISSGTEGSFLRGERIAGDTPRKPTDPMPFPHVPGYQKCGIVERVGENVHDFAPGDRVFATVSAIDGLFYGSGGHVSPAVTHRSQVFLLPEIVSSEASSGLVLTQVGFNAGSRARVGDGDFAVVIGDGLVGHWTAQTLRARGANVLLSGHRPSRLKKFELGPNDIALDSTVASLTETVADWAGNGKLAVLVDTVGSMGAVESLLPALRHFGEIVSVGFYGENGRLDAQKLRARELSFHAPSGWRRSRLEDTLAWLADGKLSTSPLITHRFPVARAADAFATALERGGDALGVVLLWEDV